MSIENYAQIRRIANTDVDQLETKGKHYGRSWLKRGGVGAFMMLARKWDRIENDANSHDFNILEALKVAGFDGKDLLDDIGDLRRYLLLVESEYKDSLQQAKVEAGPNPNIIGPSGTLSPPAISALDQFDDDIPF